MTVKRKKLVVEMDKKYALIPAYEPDGRMLELIEDAVAEGFQVIVVDDGSSDECQQYFKQAEYLATVLHHSANRGKGIALRTGFAYIMSVCEDDDIVATLDADGQHKIQDALKVCAEASLIVSNVTARLVSATVNYNINRRYVFGADNEISKSIFKRKKGQSFETLSFFMRKCKFCDNFLHTTTVISLVW